MGNELGDEVVERDWLFRAESGLALVVGEGEATEVVGSVGHGAA